MVEIRKVGMLRIKNTKGKISPHLPPGVSNIIERTQVFFIVLTLNLRPKETKVSGDIGGGTKTSKGFRG